MLKSIEIQVHGHCVRTTTLNWQIAETENFSYECCGGGPNITDTGRLLTYVENARVGPRDVSGRTE